MATPVIMPRQGQSVESCILTDWFKKVGDKISKGDLLFAYETDKASFEEEAQEDGVLLACFYEAGDEVPVLVNAAVIGSEGESVDEFRPDGGASATEEVKEEVKEEVISTSEPQMESGTENAVLPVNGDAPISPRARKLACEKRVLLDGIAGSGPGGRIIERDILRENALLPLPGTKPAKKTLAFPVREKSLMVK